MVRFWGGGVGIADWQAEDRVGEGGSPRPALCPILPAIRRALGPESGEQVQACAQECSALASRVHARLGGRMIKPCPRSETTIAPIADFEKWTGMAFPESGSYIVPDGMVPVEIDWESGLGTYIEPNVWMHHALSAA